MESTHEGRTRRHARSSRLSHQSGAVTGFYDADDAAERQSDPEKTLGVLLDNHEDLLLKILSCVVDDGVHECRRVCRRWRDACGKLPVRLGGSFLDRLDSVAEMFPEATSLVMASSFDSNDVEGRQAMQHLSRLKNLENLSLFVRSDRADINSLVTMLPSKDCLRSLSVSVDDRGALNDVLQVLRLLTNLEKLTIDDLDYIQVDMEPVTELRKLGYLSANLQVIVNSRGELLFPSLTRLTHLDVFIDCVEESEVSSNLQV